MQHLLPHRSIFNIQKLFTSDPQLLKNYKNSFVLVDDNILCKVHAPLLQCPNFIDTSVAVLSSSQGRLSFHLTKPPASDFNKITKIQGTVKSCAKLEVSIVFKTISEVIKWKDKTKLLKTILKDILKLFIFSPNSVINLNSLPFHLRYNITSILIQCNIDNEPTHLLRTTLASVIHIKTLMSEDKFNALQNKNTMFKFLSYEELPLQEIFDISRQDLIKLKLIKQVLISGPPGCGKTTLVRDSAITNGFILIEVVGHELIRPQPGETEQMLKNIFTEAMNHAENGEMCVILIDDIDVIVSGSTDHSKRVLSTLCDLLEKICYVHGVVIFATTSRPEALSPKLLRTNHLGREIIMSFPTQKQRETVLRNLLESVNVEASQKLIEDVAVWTNGYVVADLQLLVQKLAVIIARKKIPDSEENLKDEIKKLVTNLNPTSVRGCSGVFTNKLSNMDDIGGLLDVKQQLYSSLILPIQNPDAFKRMGLSVSKGVLLYGPPGCAKTTLVRAIANETNRRFMAITAAELYSPFVGEAEKKVSKMFYEARLCSPCILFIDEIDALVGTRDSSNHNKVQERVLSTLLIEMDGVGVSSQKSLFKTESERIDENSNILIIAATNRPDMVDDALKRPGRFDKLLYIPNPKLDDRLDILKKVTKKIPLASDVSLEELAQRTDLFSGADLKMLCTEAALFALSDGNMNTKVVNAQHFSHVLEWFKPSLTLEQIQFYQYLQKNKK